MKVIIHSNGPMCVSGYATQCKLLMESLRKAGHEVACSAITGLSGSPIRWNDFTIFPAGQYDYSPDSIVPHAETFGADLIITIMDLHKLIPAADALRKRSVMAWLPVDCAPISRLDRVALQAIQPTPVAMSRFGEERILEAGFGDCVYIPHAVDTSVFKPSPDRLAFRRELGLQDETFVAGICAANNDAVRKSFPEQLRAFQMFHRTHPDSVLLLHTVIDSGRGYPVRDLVEDFGLGDAVICSDQYLQVSGMMGQDMMAEWFGGLDVLLHCSHAEAFGLAGVEAQACGTPVITGDWSATKELAGPGWLVEGHEFRNPVHRAWWYRPDTESIVDALQDAYRQDGDETGIRRAQARDFALGYDVDAVFARYWAPALKHAEADL